MSFSPYAPLDSSLQSTRSRFNYLKCCYQAVCDAISCEIETQCGKPDSVQLVAVSRYIPVSDIQVLYELGHRHFGEYNVDELLKKSEIVSFF